MAIYIDVDRPYPSSIEVYSNELNKGGSKIVEVAFYSKNTPEDLTDVTVTAAFAIDKYLVAEDVTVTKETDNVCSVDISSTDNYQMFPGNLYVEFKFTKQGEEFYPSTVLVVKILPSIRMQSEVTPQSYGTVAEILREVAEARGNFSDLPIRLTDIEDKIKNYKIPDNSVTKDKIKDGEVTGAKIATGTIQSGNIGTGQVKTGNIDGGAVTENKIGTNAVTAAKIKDGEVVAGKLGVEAVQEINIDIGAVTTSRIDDEAVTYEKLDAYSLLNTSTTSQPIYDDRHLPTAQFMKDYVTNRLCGNYSIGFNDEGMAVKKTINKTLNIGEFGAETKKVYVSNQVTSIGANFFETAKKVTDIYIDNTEGKVELPAIPERVTVHYKGEFKLSDLLVNSDIAGNTKLLNLENTLSGLINGDEVAY